MKHYRQEAGMNLIANFAVPSSRRAIFDLPVCDLGWDDALVFVNELLTIPAGQTSVSFVNAHKMLMALRDREYRAVLSQDLLLPDGAGLDLASKVAHGSPFPASLKAAYFVPALLTFMEPPRRIGLIGGPREAVNKTAAKFRRHAPWHDVVVVSEGFSEKEVSSVVVEDLDRQKFDILIVGTSSPSREKWLRKNIRADHARLVLNVGDLFEVTAGAFAREPKVVRMARLKPLRHGFGSAAFLYYVLRHRATRRKRILKRPY